nr:HNH endonuclease [Microscilla sp. PRE1]
MSSCGKCGSKHVTIIKSYHYHDVYACDDCKQWTKEKIEECCRNPDTLYVFQYVNGEAKFIREQCYNCGGCLNMNKPLPHKKYAHLVDTRFSFSRERLDAYTKSRKEESDQIYAIEGRLKFEKTNYYKYLLHLESDYWKRIRLKVIERDKGVCQECKENIATEVHHLTYDNLYQERLEDLISVCQSCHSRIHQK